VIGVADAALRIDPEGANRCVVKAKFGKLAFPAIDCCRIVTSFRHTALPVEEDRNLSIALEIMVIKAHRLFHEASSTPLKTWMPAHAPGRGKTTGGIGKLYSFIT
jgi:hypothetical protein